MRYYRGYVFGICETLGRWTGFNPWIFRILALFFFNKVFVSYIITGVIFSIFLEDGDELDEKEEKREKRERKTLQQKQENPLDDLNNLGKEKIRNKGKTILKD